MEEAFDLRIAPDGVVGGGIGPSTAAETVGASGVATICCIATDRIEVDAFCFGVVNPSVAVVTVRESLVSTPPRKNGGISAVRYADRFGAVDVPSGAGAGASASATGFGFSKALLLIVGAATGMFAEGGNTFSLSIGVGAATGLLLIRSLVAAVVMVVVAEGAIGTTALNAAINPMDRARDASQSRQ